MAINSAIPTRILSEHGTNESFLERSCIATHNSCIRRVTSSVLFVTSSTNGNAWLEFEEEPDDDPIEYKLWVIGGRLSSRGC